MAALDSPVRREDRLDYMDVLRGFAVMAIFIVNIKMMFAPSAFYMNAALWSGENDQFIANLQAIFVDNKWRTTFTALFGAGLILITDKASAAGGNPAGRIRRRLVWLLIFGLIHLVLIWPGDILTIYALTGFLAVLFRNKSLPSLTIWAAVLLVLGVIWMGGMWMAAGSIPEAAAKMGPMMWGTNPEYLQLETEAFTGGILDQTIFRLAGTVGTLVFFYLVFGMWLLTLGIMVAGMALFKSGFLKGQWSAISYLVLAVFGLGAGWGIDAHRLSNLEAGGGTFEAFTSGAIPMTVAGLLGSFGYSALIGLLMKFTGGLLSPFGAVGRMAFTNYIACSVIGTTLSYGHAYGLYGTLTLQELMMIVGAVFIGMLIWSPLWLAVFRFGPLEWLWRSLTYKKLQPLLK